MPYKTLLRSLRHFADIGLTPSTAAIFLILQITAIGLEGIGLGLLLPILEYIKLQGDHAALMEHGTAWKFIAQAAGNFSIPLSLHIVMLGSFSAIFFRQVFVYAANVYRIRVREKLTHRLRLRLFNLFMNANYSVQQKIRTGEIVNELVIEAGKAVRSSLQAVRLAGSIILLLAYSAGLLVMSFKMAAFAIATLLVISLTLIPLLRRSRSRSTDMVLANEALGVFVTEWVRQSRLVRLCERFQLASDSMNERSQRQADNTVDLQVLSEKATLFIIPLSVGSAFVVLYLGITLVAIPIEILTVFVIALIRILPIAKEVIGDFQSLLSNLGSLNAIVDRAALLNAADGRALSSGTALENDSFDVYFENVSYRYDGNEFETLKQLSFKIPAGRIIALVGPSGAGKSTIVELLVKLRTPSSGRILFGTTDLTDIPDTLARKAVAYVPQIAGFIDLTIGDFLRFGNPDATQSDVELAARLVRMSDFIENLPDKYYTRLGENGHKLSGGQLQRLDLARAVLQKTSLLVLDEPSSHLDPVLTKELEEALYRLSREFSTTILVVSHGSQLTIKADEVIVINNGTIVERGRPDQLANRAGWFEKAFTQNEPDRIL